jgi:hypothetical protein
MLAQLFDSSIACQKRTGKGKMWTFYTPQGTIIKGSYKTVDKIRQRYKTLVDWNTPLISPPLEYIDGTWVVYPNLGNPPFEDCTYSLHQESFSGYSYRVLDRTTLVKLSDVLNDDRTLLLELDTTAIVIAMIMLLCLGVGDRGFYNVLYNKTTKEVHVIDIDEDNHSLRETDFWYLSRNPSSKYARQFSSPVDWTRVRDSVKGIASPQIMSKVVQNIAEEPRVTPGVSQIVTPGVAQYKGIFSSITRSGYKTDLIKSALQKWIRRGEQEKAVMAGFELYDLGLIGKPIMSNLWNRLAVIAAEDIGPADPALSLGVIDTVLRGETKPNYLGAIIQLMAQSPKTRVMSHLWRSYTVGGLNDEMTRAPSIHWKDNDPLEIREVANMFAYRLCQKDYRCFYWLGRYLEISRGMKVGPRNRRTKPEAIIWELLDCPLLAKAYFTFRENRPFLSLGVMLAIHGSEPPDHIDPYARLWEDYVKPFLSGHYTIVVDDYCVDKHTKEGRSKGRGREDFVSEGAKICNECPKFVGGVYDLYKSLYEA